MSCWLKLCYKVLLVYHRVLRFWLLPIKDTWPAKLTVLLHFDIQKASSAASSSLSAAEALFVLLGAEELLVLGWDLSPAGHVARIAPVTKLAAVWTGKGLPWHRMPHHCLSDCSHPIPIAFSVWAIFLLVFVVLVFFSQFFYLPFSTFPLHLSTSRVTP